MLAVFSNRTYRHLFTAQVIALAGTGLLTVALGLLAFDLAGEQAGAVLGTALAIKMIAYVTVAPVVGGFADRLPRRAFLVAIDLVRARIALLLPFVGGSGLAGVCPDLRSAIRLGRVHADVSGHDPGRVAGRERLHPRALALAA